MIDLHTHILPGIDDGAPTIEESVAMARAAVVGGTTTMIATPHVRLDHPANNATLIASKVAEVRAAIADAGVDLQVLPGAEVGLSHAADLSDDELDALRLAGGPFLLVECPPIQNPMGFDAQLYALQRRGHRILLAHPERIPSFIAAPDQLERLTDAGILSSVTAGSLLGYFGRPVKTFAEQLMAGGHVHNVASDAHNSHSRRSPALAEVLDEAGYGAQAQWLANDVPQAIISGTPLPPRPPADIEPVGGLLGRLGVRRGPVWS